MHPLATPTIGRLRAPGRRQYQQIPSDASVRHTPGTKLGYHPRVNSARFLLLLALVVILGAPVVVRSTSIATSPGAPPAGQGPTTKLIIVTPHVPQIRDEFGAGFTAWHDRVYKQRVEIDWRQPGGTTEILKLLQSQYGAVLSREATRLHGAEPSRLEDPAFDPTLLFPAGSIGLDLMFGGGSFDHGRLKNPKNTSFTVALGGQLGPDGKPRVRELNVSMSAPAGFMPEQLTAWYGENRIGAEKLYDPEQYWLGTALSGFGIVFNRQLLADRNMPDPRSFADLGDPRYVGLLAMADARQSGSVATLYDSILNKHGWAKGWRTLRDMCANARYFSSSSTMPPIDVGQGEALAGVAIDFYGRGQAQSLLRPGAAPESGRVGYIDPPGEVYIDADPVSILRGAPNPQLARRFIEYVLSDEGQALWQFVARTDPLSKSNPYSEADPAIILGPAQHRLRRMPVKRSIYERYTPFLADKTNPFEIASDTKARGWRDGMIVMMGCFGIDTSDELRSAWRSLNAARAAKVPSEQLTELEELFYALPPHEMKDGTRVAFSEENYKAIAADTDRWRDAVRGARARMAYTAFYREQYRKVVERATAVIANRTSN